MHVFEAIVKHEATTVLSKLIAPSKEFSNKQKKLVEKIKNSVGEKVAVALVSMQGVKGTSQAEIEVVANVISLFKPLQIKEIKNHPKFLVIQGSYLNEYFVDIIPQYISDKYSIDLVIKLFSSEAVHIASIGIEYDGHIAHYVESAIKKAYKRDSEILANSGIPLLKISPEQKSEINSTRKNISKYFKHQIKIFKNASKPNAKHKNRNPSLAIECPVCEGYGSLANDFCVECKGLGRINNRTIDLSKYEYLDCPDCKIYKSNSCSTCLGKSWIDRDKAIQWQKQRKNEYT